MSPPSVCVCACVCMRARACLCEIQMPDPVAVGGGSLGRWWGHVGRVLTVVLVTYKRDLGELSVLRLFEEKNIQESKRQPSLPRIGPDTLILVREPTDLWAASLCCFVTAPQTHQDRQLHLHQGFPNARSESIASDLFSMATYSSWNPSGWRGNGMYLHN